MGFSDDIKRVYDTFKQLNPAEMEAMQDVVSANPRNALVLKEAKDEATYWARILAGTFMEGLPENEAKARFKASIHNGPADAARHCYWSALLASKLSYNEAMRVVFTHEDEQISSSDAKQRMEARMDLHNDRVGLEIGTRMKGAGDLDLREAVMKALLHGQLVFLDERSLTLVPTRSLQPSM